MAPCGGTEPLHPRDRLNNPTTLNYRYILTTGLGTKGLALSKSTGSHGAVVCDAAYAWYK